MYIKKKQSINQFLSEKRVQEMHLDKVLTISDKRNEANLRKN